ncbi:MAG: ATP-binding protein [Lachnospiraceae bacterium]|nr:ATP-binding protein [Lachnospiraceae bacterium]
MQDITLQASDDTLYTVLDAIEAHLCKNGCPDAVKTQVLISVEEIYVNIAHYAYGGDKGEATVQMEVTQNPRICRVVFKDRGIPYNPLEKEDPDISLSAGEREIGGLGIFMVKQCMDKITYRYEDGYNILAIEKHLPLPEDIPPSESPGTGDTGLTHNQ